jgi:hypothetical protein
MGILNHDHCFTWNMAQSGCQRNNLLKQLMAPIIQQNIAGAEF